MVSEFDGAHALTQNGRNFVHSLSLPGSRRIPRPRDFSSGVLVAVFFSPLVTQFLGEALSPQIEE